MGGSDYPGLKVSLASCIIADDTMNSGGSILFHLNEKIRKAIVMIKAVELTDGYRLKRFV